MLSKKFTLMIVALLVICGLALVVPDAVMWQSLQIQAGLGNTEPLKMAAFKMGFGLVFLAVAWKLISEK